MSLKRDRIFILVFLCYLDFDVFSFYKFIKIFTLVEVVGKKLAKLSIKMIDLLVI